MTSTGISPRNDNFHTSVGTATLQVPPLRVAPADRWARRQERLGTKNTLPGSSIQETGLIGRVKAYFGLIVHFFVTLLYIFL